MEEINYPTHLAALRNEGILIEVNRTMSMRKMLLLIILSMSILIGLRMFWNNYHAIPEHPHAIEGTIDLSDWEFTQKQTITLNGDWEFFPYEFIEPTPSKSLISTQEKTLIPVPSIWSRALFNDKSSSFEYGSYRLRVILNKANGTTYAIRIPLIQSASKLFVNGQLVGNTGNPAATYQGQTSRIVPYYTSFTSSTNEIDIVIHISNDPRINPGGIPKSIRFGLDSAVINHKYFSRDMQLLLCVVLVLHGLYAFLLYYLGRRQKVLLYFLLVIFFTILSILLDDDRILIVGLPINFEWATKLSLLSYLGITYSIIAFIKEMFPEYKKMKALYWFSFICLIVFFIVLIKPIHFIPMLNIPFLLIILLTIFIIPYLMIISIRRGNPDAIYLLLGSLGISLNLGWGLLKNVTTLDMIFYPFDIIIAFLGFASYWFRHFFKNMTQTERLAAKLQIADKVKDDFLMNTSHELRNPLHGIINIAQNVLDNERGAMNDKHAKDMELLISVGRRMSFMLNDLLDLTRLKEKGLSIELNCVQLQSVATGVLDMLRFMTEDKPIILIQNIPNNFPKVLADENRLIQILFNLVHNAVKFTHKGSITISAEVDKEIAIISIKDTGMGMTEELQRRIFQPYEQGDSSITSVGGGLGLGLSICKQLVELLNGTLTVKSALGEGTVFMLTLPLSSSSDQQEITMLQDTASIVYMETAAATGYTEASAEIKAALTGDRPRILAVDDDSLNLKILYDILSTEQYEVVIAASAKEALIKLDTHEWDLIIADVMMPQMSGYELTSMIRERFSIAELPILLLTARSRPEDIYAGFRAGANDYVTKPMDALELKARVRALTNIKQSMAERLRMEAAWLQAQIQPHFLFNTLNSIAALSEINTDEMRELLSVFGDYLRASFDFKNLERTVPLIHELDLIRSYLFIEKVRFEDKLQVNWEIDETMPLQIPPLSIQPLVENAVRHGILQRVQGGVITLKITQLADYTEISISDNGVGMSEERRSQLFNPTPDKRRGIGVFNTDRRLKQIYGTGLIVHSVPDEGTTISFKIPNTMASLLV